MGGETRILFLPAWRSNPCAILSPGFSSSCVRAGPACPYTFVVGARHASDLSKLDFCKTNLDSKTPWLLPARRGECLQGATRTAFDPVMGQRCPGVVRGAIWTASGRCSQPGFQGRRRVKWNQEFSPSKCDCCMLIWTALGHARALEFLHLSALVAARSPRVVLYQGTASAVPQNAAIIAFASINCKRPSSDAVAPLLINSSIHTNRTSFHGVVQPHLVDRATRAGMRTPPFGSVCMLASPAMTNRHCRCKFAPCGWPKTLRDRACAKACFLGIPKW